MKKLILSLVVTTIAITSFGQAPEGFKYQAVVRDAGNLILNNQAVGMRLTIQQGSIGGTAVYTETFAPTTNTYGLVNIEIGTGTTTDDFSIIDWSAGPYFMETAVDVTGGVTYVVMGTSQLMSVPYALYAKTSGNGQGPAGADGADGAVGAVGATGPQGIQGPAGLLPSGTVAGNTPYWDGTSWVTNSSNIYNNGGQIGIGTATPNSELDVNGTMRATSLKVADGGTFIGMQSGIYAAGTSATVTKTVTVTYPVPMLGAIRVLANIQGCCGYTDGYTINVIDSTPTFFTAVIRRIDATSWGQDLQVIWFAVGE